MRSSAETGVNRIANRADSVLPINLTHSIGLRLLIRLGRSGLLFYSRLRLAVFVLPVYSFLRQSIHFGWELLPAGCLPRSINYPTYQFIGTAWALLYKEAVPPLGEKTTIDSINSPHHVSSQHSVTTCASVHFGPCHHQSRSRGTSAYGRPWVWYLSRLLL